jgi:hypothetical protein
MNYDLAKELKDAGFPLRRHPNQEKQPQDGAYVIDHVQYYAPTLEELIEACGEEFHALQQDHQKTGTWRAVPTRYKANNPNNFFLGSTPTEAVARLWLALNKKEA